MDQWNIDFSSLKLKLTNCLDCECFCGTRIQCNFWNKKLTADKIEKGCDAWEWSDIYPPGFCCTDKKQ